jgi:hypothetical protein
MHYMPAEVSTVPDGQYTRISGYRWPDERAAWLRPALALPTACWTCAAWQNEACAAAGGAVPPDDVLTVGCEQWRLFSDADDYAAAMVERDVVPVVLRRAA